MPKGDKLTDKQQAFVGYYADPNSETYNNATQAAIKAGYTPKSANLASDRLLGNVKIKKEIDGIRDRLKAKNVASRQIRQEFWSDMMQDEKTPKQERLRASELLGRSEADFTDNISNTVPDQSLTLTKDEQVEALRAQIRLLTDSEDAGTAVAI
jgi:phage terminase small subunit